MSVLAKLMSFGVARGLVALLAVLLSAVGGGRLGAERLTAELGDDERAPVICPFAAATVAEARASAQATGGQSFAPGIGSSLLAAVAAPDADHLRAPSLLLGSAGGPRAP